MKKFLVVGCGGSGGATLQFLMDQLRADLGGADLPTGWQFVHIDVPESPDGTGPGMPPTVPAQGGRYVPVSSRGAGYRDVATTVENDLQGRNALAQLATWRPDPEKVNIPVNRGAGQYRALGRILTLSKLELLRRELQEAYSRLLDSGASQSLQRIRESVAPGAADQTSDRPYVFVVSSMAGGSGASMALDVCRVLSTITKAQDIVMFLFTPEVFYQLPDDQRQGVESNAAAMLGELLAAQSGTAGKHDREIMSALGLDLRDDAEIPFRRVVPIGARIGGDGAVFGDGTAEGVYRGLGRGLAALMLSPVAMGAYQKQILENAVGTNVDRDSFGWGVDPDHLVWGTLGFASVGLGRDRYAEYAAQRIARVAVDRLVTGHLAPGDARPATQQLAALVDQSLWPQFTRTLGVPADRVGTRDWMVALVRTLRAEEQASTLVDEFIGRRLTSAGELDAGQWSSMIAGFGADARGELRNRVETTVYRWAYQWTTEIAARLEAEVMLVASQYGLAAARELLQRFATATEGWRAELVTLGSSVPSDLGAAPPESGGILANLRGRLHATSEPVRRVVQGHSSTVSRALRARFAATLGEVLATLSAGLVRPMAEACSEALVILEAQRGERPRPGGLAQLRTDAYQSWPDPSLEVVPPRFSEAYNEVLLTNADDFLSDFAQHVRATHPGSSDTADAIARIVTAVLQGSWPTTGGQSEILPNLEVKARWRSRVFPHDPDDPSRTPRPERLGQYRVVLTCPEVLGRARRYVARPNEPFQKFVNQSIKSFITDDEVPESVRNARIRELEDAFRTGLDLARPLVAVDRAIVRRLHGRSIQTYYSFTGIPFGDFPLAGSIRARLGETDIEPQTLVAFESAVRDGFASNASRIGIFGAYPCLSPVTFSSLLRPIWSRWAAANVINRDAFWQWRRARRLPSALPIGAEERGALVQAWFTARALGLLRMPGEHNATTVEVYDRESQAWVSFLNPLVSVSTRPRHPLDTLASVLESLPLAIAGCCNSADLAPLAPYRVLRHVADPGLQGPSPTPAATGSDGRALAGVAAGARELLGDWVLTGRAPGEDVPLEPLAGTAVGTPQERRDALERAFTNLTERFGTDFLAPGQEGAPGKGAFSQIVKRSALGSVPLVHEIAPDAYLACKALRDAVVRLPLVDEKRDRDLTEYF